MTKDFSRPQEYYQARLKTLQQTASKQKSQLRTLSLLRLLVFLIAAFTTYSFYKGLGSLLYTALPGVIVFFYLISRYTDLLKANKKVHKLIDLNNLELKVLQREFADLPTGIEYNDPNHEFSRDIDLFGKGSFFQYINRTALPEGTTNLANILKANEINGIPQKQEALIELSQHADWRQEFTASAALIHTELSTSVLLKWIHQYKPFTPPKTKIVSILFSISSFIIILLVSADLILERLALLWFFVGLGITGFYLKGINRLSAQTTKIRSTFDQYHQLMLLLENKQFESGYLQSFLEPIQKKGLQSSVLLKQFSKALDALDQRNNMLFGVLANGLLLWDLYQCRRIETWIQRNGNEVQRWFDLVSFFDAYNSLGNFVFNHPTFDFPKIVSNTNRIRATNVSHPLIDPARSVANSLLLIDEEFLIITGANMAGKSTFLRTVSLLVVMANTGLPVCAEAVEYNPIKLITSMRTSDSLTDDESYFFSELKRLKFVVEAIAKENYFVILDEILKGTNSTDKANGSKKFIEKLVKSGVTGMVATHDLSLCELEEAIPKVNTYYFDAEIVNDELYFDYKLKKGVCQNMNASFLLKKMKIV